MDKKLFFYMPSHFHNAYSHMAENAPEGFSATRSRFMAHTPSMASASGGAHPAGAFIRSMQPFISPLYNRLHIMLNCPKVRSFDASGYDIIHSGQSLLDTNVPYVMDFEHAAVFSGYNQYALSRPGFCNALKKRLMDPNLKKITPWSDAAKRSLLNFVGGRELAQKVETVYPVITPPPELEKKKHEGINLLFVGAVFAEKGGYDAMLAFDKISSKYDAQLTIVSPVPDSVKARFSKNRKILVPGPLPYGKVKKLYLESDIFVLPTHYDTFGFVIPEAFSYGLPVICDNSFSRAEIVEQGKTGLLVDAYYSSFDERGAYIYKTVEDLRKRREDCMHPTEPYINELSGAMETLIEDDSARRKMSENARKEALEGKFSPKSWKEKMGRIYEEALRV